jgi:hypothetical protein
MPSRRLFHLKPKVVPLTPVQWKFFLAQTVEDFVELDQQDTGEFYFLFYLDRWRQVYRGHQREIHAEWQRRGFTRKRQQFVLTPYAQRDAVNQRLWELYLAESRPGGV